MATRREGKSPFFGRLRAAPGLNHEQSQATKCHTQVLPISLLDRDPHVVALAPKMSSAGSRYEAYHQI